MIKLTIGTNTDKKSVMVEPDDVLVNVLKDNSVDYAHSAMHLNGSLIPGADLNNTFAELGIADGSDIMLIAVVKADSAQ